MNIENTAIILASKSPRRSELMKQAGYNFEILVSEADETTSKTVPSDVCIDLSQQKALNVFNSLNSLRNDILIVAADTIVCLDNEIMGKPKNKSEAFCMLNKLQGNTHQVYTGVTLLSLHKEGDSPVLKSFYEKTDVSIHHMNDDEINSYIATKDSFDKAGAYGIQGPFAIYVKGITGDYNNVVGLPIARLYHEIKDF